MRKQGLVHLHALCTLLREHLQNREEFESGSLDGDLRATSPAAIHRPKDDHRRAVDELATEIATAVDRDGPRTASDGGTDTTVPEDGTETTAEGS